MTAFVHWVLAQRYRLILLAVALAPILPLGTAALMTLETSQRGVVQGLSSAAIAVAGIIVLALVAGASMSVLGAIGTASLFAGVGMGAQLRWADSLALGFQATLLVCVLAVVVFTLVGPDSTTLFGPLLDQLAQVLRQRGATDAEIAEVSQWHGVLLGLAAAAAFAQLAAAMLLGYWWSSLLRERGSFGRQFRALKLGKVLGVPATLLVALGLVLNAPAVQNLAPLALFAFWFQGLAVVHAWAHARHWHPALLIPVYALLITPLTGIVILGLSAVGLVDNWFDLRRPLQPRE
jgi:hypothetical protein